MGTSWHFRGHNFGGGGGFGGNRVLGGGMPVSGLDWSSNGLVLGNRRSAFFDVDITGDGWVDYDAWQTFPRQQRFRWAGMSS